jgi:uncharacterized protein with HEPN domain
LPRDFRLYVEDMLEAAVRCRTYVCEFTLEQFLFDQKTRDAVLHNLLVLGEAAKQVPEEVRARVPQVDWRGMTGLRDIVAHHYFGVDWDAIWDVLCNELPPLVVTLGKLLEDERGPLDR